MKRSMKGWILVLLVISLFVVATGCAGFKSAHIIKLEDSIVSQKVDREAISTFRENETISKPYKILGRVYVDRRVNVVFEKGEIQENVLIETLKKQAADMGADAIINMHYSHAPMLDDPLAMGNESPLHAWASGVAIRFLENKTPQETINNIPFGVTVLPIINNAKGKTEISPYNEPGQKIAQYYLEKSGYYTELLDTKNIVTLDDIKDSTSIKQLGGEDTRSVLLLTVGAAEKADLLVMKAEAVGVRATLVSKETKDIVWDEVLTGSVSTGWILRAFVDEYQGALYQGLKLLEKLPKYEGLIEISE